MNARDESARLVIAVDGPSGSGKSSVSKEVARRFGLAYLDTGAMYRAVTWWCLDSGVSFDDHEAVVAATETVPLEMGTDPDEERILVNGEDVRSAIRGDLVTDNVSRVSTIVPAREVLVRMQQDIIRDSGFRIVAEGRDITTVVAPDADVRILLTASEAARMARRESCTQSVRMRTFTSAGVRSARALTKPAKSVCGRAIKASSTGASSAGSSSDSSPGLYGRIPRVRQSSRLSLIHI